MGSARTLLLLPSTSTASLTSFNFSKLHRKAAMGRSTISPLERPGDFGGNDRRGPSDEGEGQDFESARTTSLKEKPFSTSQQDLDAAFLGHPMKGSEKLLCSETTPSLKRLPCQAEGGLRSCRVCILHNFTEGWFFLHEF